jgi:micrococcal nuclease
MIRQGYAHEYGYPVSGKYRAEYKEAQNYARENSLGLWGDVCADTARRSGPEKCLIKGNISLKGEKIYHVPGCEYYDKTAVSESIGERWFCSEEEALNAGWRKAFNCP